MMRRLFSLGFLLLLLIFIVCFAGCVRLGSGALAVLIGNRQGIAQELEEFKDGALREFDDWLSSLSKFAITKDWFLRGKRTLGTDGYVGTYEAAYDDFSGTEYLFGGTFATARAAGETLKLTYSLKIESGSAALYWLGSAEEHIVFGDKKRSVITDVTADDVFEFTMSAGDNYIVLEGDDFTGTLTLKSEEP